MRLIDADALTKRILRARWGGWIRGDVLEKIFDSEPTIDPVVRCKDCKHWEYDVIFRDGWCRGKRQGNPNWFCADGEREKDER